MKYTEAEKVVEDFFAPAWAGGLSSLVPLIVAAGWKLISPGNACAVRNLWDSRCFPAAFGVAAGLGCLVGAAVVAIASRGEHDPEADRRTDEARPFARDLAIVVGLLVGSWPAGHVLNPCA